MNSPRGRLGARAALAVAIVAALAVSAAPAGAAKSKFKGDPIMVGMYAPNSANAVGVLFPYSVSAVKASIKAINDAGGLKGREVKLDYCDPKENPNDAANCARQFVSNGDVAVVGSFSTQGASAIVPVLLASGIANFGVYPVAAADLQSPISFPLIGGSLPVYAGAPFFLKDAGAKKIFAVHIDNASAAATAGYVKRGAAAAGVEFVGSKGIPAGAVPDMAPYVAAAKDAGADAVVLGLSEPLAVQYMQAATASGTKFKYAAVGFTPENLKKAGSAAEGLVQPSPIPPDTAATRKAFPAEAQFDAEMKAQAKTGDSSAKIANTQLPHTQRAWVAMNELAKVIKAMKGSEVTAATVLAAINATPKFNIGFGKPFGFPGPVATFPRIGNFWVYNVVVKNGKEVLVSKTPIDMASKVFNVPAPA